MIASFCRPRALFALAVTMLAIGSVSTAPALTPLGNSAIDNAVRYGLENREMGLSTFMGANWVEGGDGTLVNIYSPFMTIARAASRLQLTTKPKADDIAIARKKIKRDIEYTFQHPSVKFMVSMYGDTPDFGRKYFAQIEGVGRGHTTNIYPVDRIPQYMATLEKGAKIKPYTAINAYIFSFEDLAPLDELTLKLYGKGLPTQQFRIPNRELR